MYQIRYQLVKDNYDEGLIAGQKQNQSGHYDKLEVDLSKDHQTGIVDTVKCRSGAALFDQVDQANGIPIVSFQNLRESLKFNVTLASHQTQEQ